MRFSKVLLLTGAILQSRLIAEVSAACSVVPASCAALGAVESASCSALFVQSGITSKKCTTTVTVTPGISTKTITKTSTSTVSQSLTTTRTIQQTKHLSSTSLTVPSTVLETTTTETLTTTGTTTTTTTTSTSTRPNARKFKRWVEEHIFHKRAVPADCSCFLTSTITASTTLKASTSTSTVPQSTTITKTTVKTITVTISNVGTTLTFTTPTTITDVATSTSVTETTSTSVIVTVSKICQEGKKLGRDGRCYGTTNTDCGRNGFNCEPGEICVNGVCTKSTCEEGENYCDPSGTDRSCFCYTSVEGDPFCADGDGFCLPDCVTSDDCPGRSFCTYIPICGNPNGNICADGKDTCDAGSFPGRIFRRSRLQPKSALNGRDTGITAELSEDGKRFHLIPNSG